MTATITIYLDTQREAHLNAVAEHELEEAEQAYDANIDGYLDYLRATLAEDDITLETEPGQATYSELVEAESYEEEEEARRAISAAKDFWQWYN